MVVSPESLQSLMALLFGFAVAGLLTTGYQAATRRPLTLRVLERGPRPSTFAAVPVLAFAAPFLILRTTLRSRRDPRRFVTVMTATVIAGLWSLFSGTAVVMVLEAIRF